MSRRYVVDPEFLGLVFQLVVFGGFVILYSITVWLLLFRESSRLGHRLDRLNIVMFSISTLLLLLSLANIVIAVHKASYQYNNLDYDLQIPHGLFWVYGYAQTGICILNLIVGDGFLTYRLFIVWNRNWRITVLPILCILGIAASSVYYAILFVLPALTNLMMTCLIAGRIAWTRKRNWRDIGQATSVHRRSYWSLVETFVETAGATTIVLLAVACTIFAYGDAGLTLFQAAQPFIGLSFTLAILLVHMRSRRRPEGAVAAVTTSGLGQSRVPDTPYVLVTRQDRGRTSISTTGLSIDNDSSPTLLGSSKPTHPSPIVLNELNVQIPSPTLLAGTSRTLLC